VLTAGPTSSSSISLPCSQEKGYARHQAQQCDATPHKEWVRIALGPHAYRHCVNYACAVILYCHPLATCIIHQGGGPYRSDPRGILVIRMLLFTPMLLDPKSSEVTETAAAKMNPELRPISAFPATVATSCDFHIKKKGNGMEPMQL
jgi:hypothetical protein